MKRKFHSAFTVKYNTQFQAGANSKKKSRPTIGGNVYFQFNHEYVNKDIELCLQTFINIHRKLPCGERRV